MSDMIYDRFLSRQLEEGTALAEDSDILELLPVEGSPPRRYLACFHAKGLVKNSQGQVVVANGCLFGISFPGDYLRTASVVRVLTYLGPPGVWHPNVLPPVICVHIRPGMTLVELLHALYELWTYQLCSTRDEGINHETSQWLRNDDAKRFRFPLDKRPLRRRKQNVCLVAKGG